MTWDLVDLQSTLESFAVRVQAFDVMHACMLSFSNVAPVFVTSTFCVSYRLQTYACLNVRAPGAHMVRLIKVTSRGSDHLVAVQEEHA